MGDTYAVATPRATTPTPARLVPQISLLRSTFPWQRLEDQRIGWNRMEWTSKIILIVPQSVFETVLL